MLAKDELMTMLQKCSSVFKSSSENQLDNTAKKIEEFLAQFESLDDVKEEEDSSGSQAKGLQKTDLYHLQKVRPLSSFQLHPVRLPFFICAPD